MLPNAPDSATVIGISVAITGNILISLSLNLQKLAHRRLDAEKTISRSGSFQDGNHKPPSIDSSRPVSTVDEDEEEGRESADPEFAEHTLGASYGLGSGSESAPLLQFPRGAQSPGGYGTPSPGPEPSSVHQPPFKKKFLSRMSPFKTRPNPRPIVLPVDIVSESRLATSTKPTNPEAEANKLAKDGNESDYLKSKLWWAGFLLMNVGEMGNFISYAWAPASVVAPLGTFALIANCIFSPLILGERFRKRDLLGVVIAIVGAVTVVLSSNASDGRLNPSGLVRAISQTPFIVYTCIYIVGAAVLASLSQSSYGRRYVLVDVGLCALFGGFTVLSTKAVSTLLTMRWSEVFTSVITYPVILVLVATGVGQIRYLNRALMKFDSKVVIPIQFVLFNLSAIVGSAILYGDFKKATFHQMVTFLYGCAATFAGVFIIAWSPENKDSPENEEPNSEEPDPAAARAEHVASNLSLGSQGRRSRATLVLPPGVSNSNPLLKHKHSTISVMGLSPAQPLLLVHTPPREYSIRDVERDLSTPSSYQRQRAVSWFGPDDPSSRGRLREGGKGTRESSLSGRLRGGTGASSGSQIRLVGEPSSTPNS